MATQWGTFKASSALLNAPLSSAVANGEGWRAVVLPQYHALEVLDGWVIDTAHKSVAALGISSLGDLAYVVAVSESGDPVRFVLGVETAPPSHVAMIRADVDTLDLDAWTARVADAFAAWSADAPERADPLEVARLIRAPETDGLGAATALFGILGLGLPAEPQVSMTDLQATARARLEEAEGAKDRKKRR
jgi:hypothetical protein